MSIASLLLFWSLLWSSGLPTATLSGQVRTRDGTPLSGVQVELIEGKEHRLLPAATTGERGRYRLDHLRPGRHEGWIRLGDSRPLFAISLFPGVNRRDFTLRESVLRGQVLSPEGEPVADAVVLLEGYAVRTLPSAADGSFAFVVPAGFYRLSARKDGYAPARTAEPIDLPAGSLAETELRLSGGASLRGRLLGLPPEERSRATVQVRSGGVWTGALVEADGTYHLEGLTPGTCQVWGWNRGHTKHTEGKAVLVASEETVLDLPFSYHRVRGRAIDSEGNPVADRELAFQTDGEAKSTRTSLSGAFEVDLHDGVYAVSTVDDSEKEDLDMEEPLRVDRSLAEDFELRLAAAASSLRGRLLNFPPEGSKGGETASITAVRSGLMRYASVDSEGRFELTELSPGEWEIRAATETEIVRARITVPLRGIVPLDLSFPARPAPR